MTEILSNLTSLATTAVSMAGSVLSTVTAEGNEVLVIYMLLPLVGLGIGFLRRLFKIAR